MNKKKSALSWLCRLSKDSVGGIVFLTVLSIVSSLSGVFSAWFMKGFIDSASNHNKNEFILYAVLLASTSVIFIVIRLLNKYLGGKISLRLENNVKLYFIKTVFNKKYSEITAYHSEELMNRITGDTSTVSSSVVQLIPETVGIIVKLVGAFVVIIKLSPALSLIIIPGILLIAFTFFFRKNLKKLHKQVRDADGKFRIEASEGISGMMVVHSYSAEEETVSHIDEKMEDYRKISMKKTTFSTLLSAGLSTLVTGVRIAGAVYCGYGIFKGTITYGSFATVFQLVGQVQTPFISVSGLVQRYYVMLASAERLMALEALEDDSCGQKLDKAQIKSFYDKSFSKIVLDGISFRYPYPSGVYSDDKENPLVLNNFSMEIGKGEYIALTGHSGCGKSTVFKLIMSLYDAENGNIYIEGNDTQIPMSSAYRELFAYVPQGNMLMKGTLRDVISMGNPKRAGDDEYLYYALRLACAEDFVKNSEHKLDTVLGERGSGFSEGQLQRLAVARALISEHPILLLDEATSALDADVEKQMLTNLRSITDRTLIIVTHRPSALSICDRNIHIEKNI